MTAARVIRTGRGLVLVAALLALAAAAPRPAPRHAASNADRELLRAAAARYRGLDRYELRGSLVLHVTGARQQDLEAPFQVAYERSGKLRDDFHNPNGAMLQVSDGQSRYEYIPQLQQYRRHRRPATDEAIAAGTAGGNFAFGTGLVKTFGAIADSTKQVTRLADDTVSVDGVTRRCVVLEVVYPAPPAAEGTPVEGPRTYWIDRVDHRLLRIHSTMKRTTSQGDVTIEQVTRFDRVRLGEPVAESLFVFTPPDGARLVSQWELPGQSRPELAGQEAHDFELVDLDGKRHRLSADRGSVVLLDFWATWCGPCRMTMPLVDKLERELKPRGLIVYSINLREPRDKALGYVRQKGYDMVTLLDEKGAVGDSYQVNGIPALFVIGKDGKVAAQMVGVQQEEDVREALEDAGLN